jgi:hypothetical protein
MRKRGFAISAAAMFVLSTFAAALPEQSVAVNQAATFSSEAWINAPKQADWSREQQEELFCKQYRDDLKNHKMNRTTALNLLGTPGISYEYPRLDSTLDRATAPIKSEYSDRWDLSARKGYLVFNYNKDGMVTSYEHDPYTKVGFNDLLGNPPSGNQPQATVQHAREVARCTTIAEAQKLLGPPGKSVVDIPPDFATPFRFSSYMWNVPGNDHQFVWVRTSGMFNQDLNARSIDAVAILTIGPDFPISRHDK